MHLFSRTLILSALVFCFTQSTTSVAATIDTTAKQAVIVDFETGAVLMAKNADERMPTSSMSKVITMYAVFDALKKEIGRAHV